MKKESNFNKSSIDKRTINLETIDGLEFEKICKDIFERLNFGTVELTPPVGDEGKDIIISTNEGKIFVECKHHLDKTIGRPVIQKLHSAIVTGLAVKGIVITTGVFSKAAIQYANKVTNTIQLIDKRLLYDYATRAGFKFITSYDELNVKTFPIRRDESIKNKFISYLNDKYISKPNKIENIINLRTRNISYRPLYVLKYNINAIFETSVGLVHSVNSTDNIVIDGCTGIVYKQIIKNYIVEGEYNEIIYNNINNIKPIPFDILSNQIKNIALSNIITKHTETVQYRGRNNQVYTKTCEPKSKHISIYNVKQLYLPVNMVTFTLNLREREIDFFDTNAEDILMFSNNVSKCEICNQELSKKGLLCNECGLLTHDKSFWKSHGFYCKNCGKTICRNCANYYVKFFLFKKVLCSDCAKNFKVKKMKKFKKL